MHFMLIAFSIKKTVKIFHLHMKHIPIKSMFYLSTSLFLLFLFPMVSSVPGISTKIVNKDAEFNRFSSPKYKSTLPTPVHKNLNNTAPKDIEGFLAQYKDEYHINPNSKQELEHILAYSDHLAPKFHEDSINLTTQRFEEIQAKYAMREATTSQKNILRQWQWTDSPHLKNVRTRAYALMTQFVYAARYKLLYGQLLQAKNNHTLEYKIGYCFAKMREAKQQQLSLYSTMDYNLNMHRDFSYTPANGYPSYADFGTYLALYEKIVRLDVDLMDLIKTIKEFEAKRKAIAAKTSTEASSTAFGESDEYVT